MAISIRDIHKAYGRYPALNGVSLEVKPGELLALLALVTLFAKVLLEKRVAQSANGSER